MNKDAVGPIACRILKTAYRLMIVAGCAVLLNSVIPRRASIRAMFETPRIYVTEVRYAEDAGFGQARVYSIYYSIHGERYAEVFATKERLLAYVAYLETVGTLVGPKDNGGWIASVWGGQDHE